MPLPENVRDVYYYSGAANSILPAVLAKQAHASCRFGKASAFVLAEALAMGLGMVQVIIAWAFGNLAWCHFVLKVDGPLVVNARMVPSFVQSRPPWPTLFRPWCDLLAPAKL